MPNDTVYISFSAEINQATTEGLLGICGHGVGFDINGQVRFEQKSLRERLDSINADQTRISKILCERTALSTDEANQLFLEAVTKDPEYARSKGIISDVREIKVPEGATFLQLVFKR